jgi:hypothetical protein
MGPTNKQMALTATPPEQKPTVVVDAQIVAPTPLSVVELAIQRGASVDTLTKLFELQERLDARAAKKAFDAAFAAFQAEAPDLERTKEVSYGQGKTAYKYTPLDQITRAYRPVLAKHGLSFSWTQAQPAKDVISVTCTLKHVQGHSESCSLEGPPDNSGSKNAVQSISSGVSYLRRYTLLGVTGGATGDEDTDGMTMGNAADFLSNIESASNAHELERSYKDAIAAAVKAVDANAIKAFTAAKDKRKAQLAA